MLLQQKPVVGYWYANVVGQLLQVRALMYRGKDMTCIAMEFTNGRKEYVDLAEWYALDLVQHAPQARRRRAKVKDQ